MVLHGEDEVQRRPPALSASRKSWSDELIIVHADKAFMALRREKNLPLGWWIVDVESNSFFDGPYRTKKAALERYERLPFRLRETPAFGRRT